MMLIMYSTLWVNMHVTPTLVLSHWGLVLVICIGLGDVFSRWCPVFHLSNMRLQNAYSLSPCGRPRARPGSL